MILNEPTLKQSSREGLGFSAQLHSQIELDAATHTCHLEERVDRKFPSFVNIDSSQMGVGGDVSWSSCVYLSYLLKPDDEVNTSFWIFPVFSDKGPA